MRSFGIWLWQNRDQGSDVQRLRRAAAELGPDWPIQSTERTDYETSVTKAKQDPERTELIEALGRVWPTYEAENARTTKPEGQASLGSRLLDYASNIGVWGVALGGLLLIVLLFKSFDLDFLKTIADVEAARGLITFLFAVVTVGIAVVVVLAVLLSNATNEELAERFQRGKDVLTILIGVFGAILGFYFGSEARESVEQQVAALRQEVATLRQTAEPDPALENAAPQGGAGAQSTVPAAPGSQ
ncbi:MAG TPA: hypothetical protein VHG92_05840 [Afifellaceae bacterium]|nr:hypothetical protein [Afifellaceae bacterium]